VELSKSPRISRAVWPDALAICAVGLAIGVWLRGHFPLPYPDFMDFVDPGHALWQGQIPETLKRAPFYPLLVVALGQLFTGEAPERTAAGWLMTLLLPANGLLIYLIGLNWVGRAARWAALLFLFTPLSLFLTGHEIVEPLLTFLILAAVLAAQRSDPGGLRGGAPQPGAWRGGWAYGFASLAAITRYDATGLVLGLICADLLRRESLRRVVVRGGLALLPLAGWLALSWFTWPGRSEEHYVRIIAERSRGEMIRAFPGDLLWSLRVIRAALFDGPRLDLTFWLQPFAEPLTRAVEWTLSVLALVGAAALAGRERRAFWTAGAGLVGYVVVHAVFPFRLERFGYPMAPLMLLAAFAGWSRIRSHPRAAGAITALKRWGLPILAVLLAAGVLGEVRLLAMPRGSLVDPGGLVALFAAIGGAAAAFTARRGRRVSRCTAALGLTLLVLVQVRAAGPALNWGFEMANQVTAARWLRSSTSPTERVLSVTSPLFRLYVGRTPPDRFINFEHIRSETWADILAECRARGIRWVVWHDQVGEQYGEYGDRWRLGRFSGLGQAEPPAGMELARFFPARPNLWIYRVQDAAGGSEN